WSQSFSPVALTAIGFRRRAGWTGGCFGHAENAVVDDFLDGSAHGTFLHALDAFTGKCEKQQVARCNFVDAARTQIEEGIFFDLSNRGSVSALDVVGENFELGLGVDLRVVREQQVAIGLLGVGLLCFAADNDATVENAVSLII